MTIIKVDYENNAERFWKEFQDLALVDVPIELWPLRRECGNADEIEIISSQRVKEMEYWCSKIPGYADGPEHAREALLFCEEEL